MPPGFLVVDIVLLAVQLNDDVGILFGNFDLNGFGCKFILDLHDVSFPLEAAPDGRDKKEPEVTMDTPADNAYKKAWQSTVGTSSSKNLLRFSVLYVSRRL